MSIDLHTHSIYSDGADTPKQLLLQAVNLGLNAVALTDHDTISGIDEFIAASHGLPIQPVIGIEISASYYNHDIHILGYDLNPQDPTLCRTLTEIRGERSLRNKKMLQRLNDLGYALTYEEIASMASGQDKVISRLHYAKALMQHGYTQSIAESFDTLLNPGCPGYIPRQQLSPQEALRLILGANGIPVLAHPLLYPLRTDELISLLEQLTANGLRGLEVIHSTVSPKETLYLKGLADTFGLHYTGGSDYHGVHKPGVPLGCGADGVLIPDEYLANLRCF